eukprot:CAMPEP_0174841270 /NCGR_PEP_ID=MMETSP1114-20130205/9208_1 /TAXON_ID=312471 /ORGANISM="Neobodo designis, Strain CCAP 1951/1" /LENGTH=293 /DNA_ID=CAMNT_0016075451 /DNA_START=58 /DNA_END=939 /DNA_ORIENTATION=+
MPRQPQQQPPASAGTSSAPADDWASLSAAATRTIDALEDRARALRRQSQRIVAPKDASRAKQSLRESREADGDLVSGARETLRRLEAHVQTAPANAGVTAALGKAAVMALESFEAAQMGLVRRVQEVESAAGAASGAGRRGRNSGSRRSAAMASAPGAANATGDGDDDDEEGTALVPQSSGSASQQQQQREAFQIDVYDDIMRERSREVAEIAENIRDVHEIFQHISVLVREQGEEIEKIESNVDGTADEVTRGRIELERARQHQRDNSSVRCYVIALCFIIGFMFLVAVLYK